MRVQITWVCNISGQITWATFSPNCAKSGPDYLEDQITWSRPKAGQITWARPKWAGRFPGQIFAFLWLLLPYSTVGGTPTAAKHGDGSTPATLRMTGKQKRRRGAGSVAHAMQRRDGAGHLFCHRSNGRGHPESSREGRLVQREQKSMHERKGLRECVEAVNAERRQLDEKRRQLQQVRSRLTHTGSPPPAHSPHSASCCCRWRGA